MNGGPVEIDILGFESQVGVVRLVEAHAIAQRKPASKLHLHSAGQGVGTETVGPVALDAALVVITAAEFVGDAARTSSRNAPL